MTVAIASWSRHVADLRGELGVGSELVGRGLEGITVVIDGGHHGPELEQALADGEPEPVGGAGHGDVAAAQIEARRQREDVVVHEIWLTGGSCLCAEVDERLVRRLRVVLEQRERVVDAVEREGVAHEGVEEPSMAAHQLDGGGELVGHAAADTEHVELLEGQRPRADGRGRPGETDHDDTPAVAGQVEGGLQHVRPAGRVDDGVRTGAPSQRTERRRVRCTGVEPGAGDELASGGDRIDERHPAAAVTRRDRGGEADRTGTEHDDLLAGPHARPHDGVDGDGDRLDESRLRRIQVRGGDDVRGVDEDEILQRAVVMHADQVDLAADVRPIGRAGPAATTPAHRPDGHPVADLERRARGIDRFDDGGELVTLHTGEQLLVGGTELVREEVQIRTADADGLDTEQGAALGRWWRLRSVDDVDRPRTDGDRRSHGCQSP